jgi:uncharacterized membrane protein
VYETLFFKTFQTFEFKIVFSLYVYSIEYGRAAAAAAAAPLNETPKQ